jgi:hypothetical protein
VIDDNALFDVNLSELAADGVYLPLAAELNGNIDLNGVKDTCLMRRLTFLMKNSPTSFFSWYTSYEKNPR